MPTTTASKALTGDYDTDFVGNRTKRIFDDPVGGNAAAMNCRFLIQTYRRDTGEIMHDISSPFMFPGAIGADSGSVTGRGSPPFFCVRFRPAQCGSLLLRLILNQVAATATRVLRVARGSRLPSYAPCVALRRATSPRRPTGFIASRGFRHSGCGRASCVCLGVEKLSSRSVPCR